MLSRLFRSFSSAASAPLPRPGCIVEVIGDIHGRADLLEALGPPETGAIRVTLGDYVDRGPASRRVLEYLHARNTSDGWVCLRGNHEEMFLGFLENPEKAYRWLRYGGAQTLESFGLPGLSDTSEPADLRAAAKHVRAALPFDPVRWLRGLPAIRTFGTLTVVHAGLDPFLPLDAQSEQAALWGHPEFGMMPRQDGQWVVHGHTVVKKPLVRGRVISIDTGAWSTGHLTLVRVAPEGDISFRRAMPS